MVAGRDTSARRLFTKTFHVEAAWVGSLDLTSVPLMYLIGSFDLTSDSLIFSNESFDLTSDSLMFLDDFFDLTSDSVMLERSGAN